ncbi:MAG: hypothetical protein ACXVJD_14125 [Mucilaginibacter sp.]
MKKYTLRLIAVLLLASAILPGCSVAYRQRHGHYNNGRGHDDHDRDHDRGGDHHYRNY